MLEEAKCFENFGEVYIWILSQRNNNVGIHVQIIVNIHGVTTTLPKMSDK